MAELFEPKYAYQQTEEYKEFEKAFLAKESRGRKCSNCSYFRRQPHGICGLVSSLCVDSPNKPYHRDICKDPVK